MSGKREKRRSFYLILNLKLICSIAIPLLALLLLPTEASSISANRPIVFRENKNGQANTGDTWYFAEGSNAWGFGTGFAVENPNNEEVNVEVKYFTPEGKVDGGKESIKPLSSKVISTDKVEDKDFSTILKCIEGKKIVVERITAWVPPGIMWIPECDPYARHSSIGATAPSKIWYHAEGSSAWGFKCWLLLLNPNDVEANCRITYFPEGGTPLTFNKVLPKESRSTFNIAYDIGEADTAIKVESDVPVVSERSMYCPYPTDAGFPEGHSSIGSSNPSNDHYYAEGSTNWGFSTYLLLLNPTSEEVSVSIDYMSDKGDVFSVNHKVSAESRKTIRVNDFIPPCDFSTRIKASLPIVTERSVYSSMDKIYTSQQPCFSSIGVSQPHKLWYLPFCSRTEVPEGFFEWQGTYLLVQNPNDEKIKVKFDCLIPEYPPYSDNTDENTSTVEIPARSRYTCTLNEICDLHSASIIATSMTPGKGFVLEQSTFTGSRSSAFSTIGWFSD